MKRLYSWNGKLYGVLFDADAQTLYYRKDVFANPDNQAKFKAKYGYDLPAPPTTMQQMHDLADFFTGWDWNGDGSPDWGLALHAKVNAQGFFHFLTLAAPYICSPDNKYFYFHPETMKPLINSPGHLRALEDYIKFLPNGPREEIAWTLGQGWNLFLTGKAVMEATWGDLPTLAQDPKTSQVQGKIGAAPIPGVPEAYDPINNTWKKYPLNQAGNVNGGSWHCVISRFTQEKEATYDFLAFMANRKNAFFNVTHGFTGVQPGMRDEYLPPAGTATLAEWHAQGWNEADAKAFMDAYYANLALPVAGAVSAHSRRGGLLAPVGYPAVCVACRADHAAEGVGRHRGGMGGHHQPLRARAAEGAVCRVVRLVRLGPPWYSPRRHPRCSTGRGRQHQP